MAEKKDLTNLMDYAKAMEASGQAAPIPEGSVMEEAKIDKIEAFESLDDYGKANPAPEPAAFDDFAPPDDVAGTLASLPLEPPPPQELAQDTAPSEFETTPAQEFATTQAPAFSSDSAFVTSPSSEEPAFEMAQPTQAPAEPASEPVPEIPQDAEPESFISPGAPALAAPEPMPEPTKEPLRPAAARPPASQAPLQKIKQYAESLAPVRVAVPAAYPFSVLITGHLAADEKARLLDLVSRENMGIRELDLEPQLESGKVLIPRISEYAAVMIVSALRSARARIRMGPSDTIYATPDTQDDARHLDTGDLARTHYSRDSDHPAEHMPITAEEYLPGKLTHALVDIVTASAALKTMLVSAENSPEYQQLLEALQREIKYKAFRKGATAIVGFEVKLTQLHLPTHYRLMVTGSAITSRSQGL